MEYITSKGCLNKNGNKFLRYKLQIPVFDNQPQINDFFDELFQSCLLFCRERLPELLEDTNESNREIYGYSLFCTVTHHDGRVASVVIKSNISLGTGKSSQSLRAVSFDLNDGQMIPPALLYKKYSDKNQKFKKSQIPNLFLDKGLLSVL